jgi:hypothetical protein
MNQKTATTSTAYGNSGTGYGSSARMGQQDYETKQLRQALIEAIEEN